MDAAVTLITDTADHIYPLPYGAGGSYYVRDLTFLYPEKATLGACVGFHQGCFINAWGGLEIGDMTAFGPNCMIHTTDHDTSVEDWKNTWVLRPVKIGANCWFGMGAIICPGSEIGDSCTIGAGAVVRGRIPPRTIVVGDPARMVGRRG